MLSLRSLVNSFFLFALLALPAPAAAGAFVPTLTAELVDDVNGDGFGAGDTIAYRLQVTAPAATDYDEIRVIVTPPAGSVFHKVSAKSNYGAEIDNGQSFPNQIFISFFPAPGPGGETAEVEFRLTVNETKAVSLAGQVEYFDGSDYQFDESNTVVFTPGQGQAGFEGAVGASVLYDGNYLGIFDAGEALRYAAVITNTGENRYGLAIRAVLDPDTQLLPDSVVTSTGRRTGLQDEGELDLFLSQFPSGTTAFVSFAVTAPATLENDGRSIQAKLIVEDGQGTQLFELSHATRLGPPVQLVATLAGANPDTIYSSEVDYVPTNIAIQNDGPLAVTGVTVTIKPIGEPPAALASFGPIDGTKPELCQNIFSNFCAEDGTLVCRSRRCIDSPGPKPYTHGKEFGPGEKFNISWGERFSSIEGMYYASYRVEIKATEVGGSGETFTLVQRVDRLVDVKESSAYSALSPWVALTALGAAGAYAYRQRRRKG